MISLSVSLSHSSTVSHCKKHKAFLFPSWGTFDSSQVITYHTQVPDLYCICGTSSSWKFPPLFLYLPFLPESYWDFIFLPVEDREEHLLYWRRASYPPPCCSIAQLCLTETPWTAAHQASLSFTVSWNSSLGKLQTIFFFPFCDLSFQGQTMGKKKKKNMVKTCLFSPRRLTFDSFLSNRKKALVDSLNSFDELSPCSSFNNVIQ